jgi:two-component sensor histidine kinase/PAS domain-containing protein
MTAWPEARPGGWESSPSLMAGLVRGKDWSATPLGPMSGWSPALKLVVDIVLNAGFPMALRWGPDFVLIYNDGYRPILGDKHPWALGRPAREAWSEVWDEIQPLHQGILRGGPAVFAEDMLLRIQRFGARWDDARFTLGYSPVHDPTAPTGVGGILVTAVETTRSVTDRAQLRAEREHLTDLFRQAPGFICVLSGPDHCFELANDSYRELVGGRDVVGKTVAAVLPEVVGQRFIILLDQVFATGQPYVGAAVPATLDRPGGPAHVFLDFVYQPIRDAEGQVSGIFVEGMDVTERTQAAERQQMLVNELNHRVKNSLATVQSITTQTLRSATTLEGATSAIEDRIQSLARAHDTLTRENWSGADLEEVLRRALEPFERREDPRFVLRGGAVRLSPSQALALALAFHELATNAAKYGALSDPAGRVEVVWRRAGAELKLAWREQGGPPVAPLERRGFGSRLLERGLSRELGGSVDLTFAPAGVVCEIVMPLVEPAAGQ